MKIAQVAPPWSAIAPQQSDAVGSSIYHLVEELHTRGHEVTVFAPADACTSVNQHSFLNESLDKERTPWQAHLKAYYHFHKSIAYIAAHDFDIVHTHFSTDGDMYLFPLLAALHKPQLMTLHCTTPLREEPQRWERNEGDYFMEWVQQVPLVTTSNSARRHLQISQLSIACLDTIHYGVPIPERHTDHLIHAEEHTTTGQYFVWIGAFTYEQGAHLAIEAARKADRPLLLIGTKEPENPDAMRYYRHLIEPFLQRQQQPVLSQIGPQHQIYHLSTVTRQQQAEILQHACALLNPNTSVEFVGLHLLEAMAAGCPVISFANGVAPEMVEHGYTGFLVQDLPDMLHAMSRVHTLDRAAIHNHSMRFFSTQMMTDNYLHLYSRTLATHTLPRITVANFAHTDTIHNILSAS